MDRVAHPSETVHEQKILTQLKKDHEKLLFYETTVKTYEARLAKYWYIIVLLAILLLISSICNCSIFIYLLTYKSSRTRSFLID